MRIFAERGRVEGRGDRVGGEVVRALDAPEELIVHQAVRALGDDPGGRKRRSDRDLARRGRRGDAHDHDARPLRHAGARARRQARGAGVEVDPRQVPGVRRHDL